MDLIIIGKTVDFKVIKVKGCVRAGTARIGPLKNRRKGNHRRRNDWEGGRMRE